MSGLSGSSARALLGALAITGTPTSALAVSGQEIAAEVKSLFAAASPAVVRVEAVDAHGRLAGTGFFISPNGMLFTSYTLGGSSRDVSVKFASKTWPAQRLIAEPRAGIALLKIEADTPFLTIANPSEIAVDTPVVAIGYPQEREVEPALGAVAGFETQLFGRYFCVRHIRANLPVQGGHGGAPVLDFSGRVVGILVASVPGGAGGFALPIDAAEKVRLDFMRFGELRPGYLGAEIEPAPAASGDNRVARVSNIDPGGPAAHAGMRAGDVLVKFGGRPIRCPSDVITAAYHLTAGDDVALTVQRDGNPIDLTVTATNPPAKRAAQSTGTSGLLHASAPTADPSLSSRIAPPPLGIDAGAAATAPDHP